MTFKKTVPDITVIVPTYCHEGYISQALDSILDQETDLQYEVLVGDDASTDRTLSIVQEYAKRYPDIIIPLCRKENVGATKNNWDMHMRARWKYISLLEGDDFWTDPYKLHKQYVFLEENPEYIGCCSKCLIVDENGQPDYERSCHIAWNKKIFTLSDFINSWQLAGQASTRMCRNFFSELDPTNYSIYYKAHRGVGDKTMMLFLLSRGSVYCSNEVLSAYRFVDKKDDSNWFSLHHANPYRNYDMFMYPCNLESWARKNMKLPRNVHFGERNPYRFARFVEECVKKPERKRFQYLCKMIIHSRQPLKYSWYVLKALIEMEN